MPGLKFRVLLDSDKQEEIFRDVLISDMDNFENFFNAILQAFEFKGKEIASFYVSNDDWDKGHEINLLDMSYDDDAIDQPSAVMKEAIIKNFLEEPDQKFILVYDFMRMWIFLIELIGFDKTEPKTPSILLSVGKAPLENSKDVMDETLFSEGQIDSNEEEDDFEDDDDFEDGYGDDDLNGFNEYEY
jgi:hypothetical protein